MTLSERLAILDGRSNSNESWMEGSIIGDEYVAIAREAVAALAQRDELLRRAREIVNIAQLYMESGNEAPEEDWFMVDGWIRDYEAITKEMPT